MKSLNGTRVGGKVKGECKMIIEVNGREIEARPDETILSALNAAGVRVPTLCHMEGLAPTGACRMCVVEVEGFNGLVPSCSYPVADGMKIRTDSPRVIEARRTIVELLLANHPDDCLYCSRGGDCELQRLARELGVRQRIFRGERKRREHDISSPAIIRDPDKCILCGRCVRVCEEVQSVSAIDFIGRGSATFIGTAFNRGLNVSSCVYCGQCVRVCPTGALTERSSVADVMKALADPTKLVVVQHAPAVSVTIAEEFGRPPGEDADGVMVAAMRRLGFDRVFDTSFAADLTIMEEGSELVSRITGGGVLPMMTSCSPGWIKFVEEFYPDMTPNLSTCKSPQQMMGAIIKSFFADQSGMDPANIVSVSVMPCTAKKFEAQRPEMGSDYVPDVDHVLTTRELAQLIRVCGVEMLSLEPEAADTPFGERSTAGKIFGVSGGVMEAAVRTASYLITGEELGHLEVEELRGLEGIKLLTVNVGDLELKAAVASGLGNARALLEQVRSGDIDLHFIEVMTCPGGCINGGGQPVGMDREAIEARMKMLYQIDGTEEQRVSHKNKWVRRLYDEFLEAPLGEASHRLLHTRYDKRDVLL